MSPERVSALPRATQRGGVLDDSASPSLPGRPVVGGGGALGVSCVGQCVGRCERSRGLNASGDPAGTLPSTHSWEAPPLESSAISAGCQGHPPFPREQAGASGSNGLSAATSNSPSWTQMPQFLPRHETWHLTKAVGQLSRVASRCDRSPTAATF